MSDKKKITKEIKRQFFSQRIVNNPKNTMAWIFMSSKKDPIMKSVQVEIPEIKVLIENTSDPAVIEVDDSGTELKQILLHIVYEYEDGTVARDVVTLFDHTKTGK